MSLHFHALQVLSVEPESDSAKLITFEVPPPLREAFAFQAGQYLTLRAEVGGEDLRRSYSLCAAPHEGRWQVGVRSVRGGRFSSWVNAALKPGDRLEVFPPQGRFVLPPAPSGQARHVLAVAAGSGITPILAIVQSVLALEPDSRVTLVYGNRRLASTMFKEALEDLKNRHMQRLTLHMVFSDEAVEADLFAGRLDYAKLSRFFQTGLLRADGVDEAFVCGPQGMNDQAEAALRDAGIKPERIHVERFGTPEMQQGQAAPHEHHAEDADEAHVTIYRDGMKRTFDLDESDASILDAAHRHGLDLPYSCRSGVCATCRCKVLVGEVRMDRNFSLSPAEVAAGFVLACQSHALTDEVTLSFDER
ncbi:MAG: phenylacetate-CoA oxygenase/reductase subunit PaaK [Burkholderiales bacterium]|nr:phenylacetate-CoA oxygenase/reductase subunit PaaK [Burkholderiales bacterium]